MSSTVRAPAYSSGGKYSPLVSEERAQRAGKNEALFRSINEQIAAGERQGTNGGRITFLCLPRAAESNRRSRPTATTGSDERPLARLTQPGWLRINGGQDKRTISPRERAETTRGSRPGCPASRCANPAYDCP